MRFEFLTAAGRRRADRERPELRATRGHAIRARFGHGAKVTNEEVAVVALLRLERALVNDLIGDDVDDVERQLRRACLQAPLAGSGRESDVIDEQVAGRRAAHVIAR